MHLASTRTLLCYGALLHDIGKVVQRDTGDIGTHSELGADFVHEYIGGINEGLSGDDGQRVAEQIRYHHTSELAGATGLPVDSLAYITWFANLVATGLTPGCDKRDEGVTPESRDANLRKIFNTLNGHHDDNVVEHDGYGTIREALRSGLAQIGLCAAGINAVLGLLESTLNAVPTSTDESGLIDVSLYDHAKVTAAIATCVYEYMVERGVGDYRKELFDTEGSGDAGSRPMFLLYSCDMSGIQDFIYNISGSGALKQLRARSMYLELLLEHIADELLERLGLSRANLLYTGGGHAYMLLPNTAKAKEALRCFGDELEAWFVGQYKTDLYVASAWVECCADDLANRGADKRRYPRLYQRLSRCLSEAKATRYDAKTIRALNFGPSSLKEHARECSECHRSDLHIDEDGKCAVCAALGMISKSLVDKDVFVVDREEWTGNESVWNAGLALPFGCVLRMYTADGFRRRGSRAHRAYVKNGRFEAMPAATNIWMGDYTADTQGEGIAAYASQGADLNTGPGIRRLGVLRADVDDLGAAFVSGLPDEKVSISRTSVLSRSLSYFFKSEVNRILDSGAYQVQVIYSGGDDLFIVGNWSDVLYAAIDIRKSLDEYTGNGSLTLSAGIGMFGATYPISRMASETGSLEDDAKDFVSEDTGASKNAVALWSDELVFGWSEFTDVVLPRMHEVRDMFARNQKGMAFVYRILELLRTYDALAGAPRLAYLLARSFEDDYEGGGEACGKLYAWAQDPKERRRLVAALEWYIYSERNGSEL